MIFFPLTILTVILIAIGCALVNIAILRKIKDGDVYTNKLIEIIIS